MKTFAKLLILFISVQVELIAQNTWTLKAPIPVASIESASSFSIGNKGYVVTGVIGGSVGSIKLWEYDPVTDNWSPKADFPGVARYDAVAFAIGNKGYVGTGTSVATGGQLNDFWEWDQTTNTWIQKANFIGTPRKYSAAFAVNGKGYIGTGWDNTQSLKKDFYEYDPITNIWIAKANLPTVRYAAVGFAIGNKGYICSGGDGSGILFPDDLQEYDPLTNSWTAKASLPSSGGVAGAGRNLAFGFAIGTSGFIGTGTYIDSSMPIYCQDFWEYDQLSNTWTQRASFPGGYRQYSFGFAVGNKGYAGSGEYVQNYFNDVWEWSSSVTGIAQYDESSELFTIYPSPATDVIFIDVPASDTYTIYDVLGHEVASHQMSRNESGIINLQKLQKGVYILRADHNPSVSKMFVVSR